jgi:hypothetical protein
MQWYFVVLDYLYAHYFHYLAYALLILLVFFTYKSGLIKDIVANFRKNKIFFLLLVIAAIAVAIKCYPFTPLVYYDEQNYIIEAQNIVENRINSLCNLDDSGRCLQFSLAPHGIGMSSLYSLLYSHDFKSLYRNAGIFNLILYLLNALIIFVIALRIFKDVNVARISACLVLIAPYNIVYSTNIMPDSPSNTFLLLIVYALVTLLDNKEVREYSLGLLILSTVWLSSLRVEYSLLLTAVVIILVAVYVRSFRHSSFSKFWGVFMLLVIVVMYAYFLLYSRAKLLGGAHVGLRFANLSYIQYYFSTVSFALLTGCFVIYLIYMARTRTWDKPKLFVLALFFSILVFYSFYNFGGVYRFLIPATSLYMLFAAAGISMMLKRAVRYKRLVYLISIFLILAFSADLVPRAFAVKASEINAARYAAHFMDIISLPNLALATKNHLFDSFYYFRPSYLGGATGMRNYMADYQYAVSKLRDGSQLYYIDSFFEKLEKSQFSNPVFAHELVYNDTQYGYNIYQISFAKE